MLALIIKTSAIISSAVLYRLGGAEGCSTKYRDFGVPIIAYITGVYSGGIRPLGGASVIPGANVRSAHDLLGRPIWRR